MLANRLGKIQAVLQSSGPVYCLLPITFKIDSWHYFARSCLHTLRKGSAETFNFIPFAIHNSQTITIQEIPSTTLTLCNFSVSFLMCWKAHTFKHQSISQGVSSEEGQPAWQTGPPQQVPTQYSSRNPTGLFGSLSQQKKKNSSITTNCK